MSKPETVPPLPVTIPVDDGFEFRIVFHAYYICRRCWQGFRPAIDHHDCSGMGVVITAAKPESITTNEDSQ